MDRDKQPRHIALSNGYLGDKLRKNIAAAMLGAFAFIVMLIVSIPVIPSAAYLKYEPSGAVLLLAGTLINPAAGVLACLIKDLLFFLAAGGNIFGVCSDFMNTACFVLAASLTLPKHFRLSRILAALLVATLAAALIMIPTNFAVLFLEFGMLPAAVWASMPAIIPFNLLKGALNSGIYLLLFQPVSKALKRGLYQS